ncbi:MAG: hypothetical protein HKN68_06830 [Saprospiraceae bacterium]|nr:hypothetical protein [Saprospiraceae bacterium]
MKFSLVVMLLVLGQCSNKAVHTQDTSASTNSIGVKQFIWTDESRTDDYNGGNRIINAKVWYPSEEDASLAEPALYYFKIEEAYQSLSNWSEEDLKSVNEIKTNSSLNAPIKASSDKYPLIIFSPGLGGNLSLYSFYAESLAERGYIVMGINHLYESEYVIDQVGNTHPVNITFHDSLKTLDIPGQITADQYREVKGERQKVLGEDIVFGLNQILNDAFFREHLDKDRIGVFGHSIGGAGAIYANILDDRIKAVIDLDGTPPSLALANGISAPFLFVEDLTDYENHQGYAKQHARRNDFCVKNKSESWRILMGGSSHSSFTDMGYIFGDDEQEKRQALKFLKLTSGYMHSFFSHHLKAEDMDLEEMKSDSLEIIYFAK